MPTSDSSPNALNMSVCYFGTFESQYPRNRIFIKGLKAQGVIVHECHVPLWELQEHKGASFGFSIGFLLRFIYAQLRLLFKFIFQPHADVIMVGYIGHLDMFLAWMLARLSGSKLVFNPLVSLFDTVVGDRGFVSKSSLKGRLLLWLDKVTCGLADLVLLDTEQHIHYFKEDLGIKNSVFQRVWVGADDEVFKPLAGGGLDGQFNVLFVGKFIPLHGLPKLIEMAKILECDKAIRITIIGSGQLQDEIHKQAKELKLSNTQFIDYVPYEILGEAMQSADLVLGIFGDSDKSRRVIPNKLYQALAVGKAVLSVDSPAARELLKDNETAFLCPAEPEAMADRILEIKQDRQLLERVAGQGADLFRKSLGTKALGKQLVDILGLDLDD